jgi:hypothetical protein
MNRCCLTRWLAAGAVGALLLFGGCAADGAAEKDKGWHPFAKDADTSRPQAAKQTQTADSFPTAAQAGL